MAFLTGVGLETCIEEESDEEALELVPQKRLALPAPRTDYDQLDLALLDDEPPSFGQLLKNVQSTGDDPLAELKRRIKRTRAKMDEQNKVMDGFMSDVRQMQGLDREFYSSALSLPSPSTQKAALPAPAATRSRSLAALGPPAAPALPGPAPGRRPAARSGATELALSTRPSSATTTGASSRGAAVRSDRPAGTLGQSQSQPSLNKSSVLGGLHQKHSSIVMPQRRAPPGAANSETLKSSALSSLRRHAPTSAGSPSEIASASKRYPSLGRHRLSI